MVMGLATVLLLALCLRVRGAKVRPLDRTDLVRFRRDSEMRGRDWMYTFE
jgi:hypothetical protein